MMSEVDVTYFIEILIRSSFYYLEHSSFSILPDHTPSIRQVPHQMLLPPTSPASNLLILVAPSLPHIRGHSHMTMCCNVWLPPRAFPQEGELGRDLTMSHTAEASASYAMSGIHRCSVNLRPLISLSHPVNVRSCGWEAGPVRGHLVSTPGTQHKFTLHHCGEAGGNRARKRLKVGEKKKKTTRSLYYRRRKNTPRD